MAEQVKDPRTSMVMGDKEFSFRTWEEASRPPLAGEVFPRPEHDNAGESEQADGE